MNKQSNLTQDTWEVVQHNWHETSISSKENQQRICKLDTEDWDVNEDNQYELEEIQLKLANMICAAPDMLDFLKKIQTSVSEGNITLNQEMVENLQNIIHKATTTVD